MAASHNEEKSESSDKVVESSDSDKIVETGKDQSKQMDDDVKAEVEKFHEGKENSHATMDSKDERTIKNKLEAASKDHDDNEHDKKISVEEHLSQIDPTMPARLHGNEPSRGAKIDASIMDDEKELIAKMDAKKEQSQKAKHK